MYIHAHTNLIIMQITPSLTNVPSSPDEYVVELSLEGIHRSPCCNPRQWGTLMTCTILSVGSAQR